MCNFSSAIEQARKYSMYVRLKEHEFLFLICMLIRLNMYMYIERDSKEHINFVSLYLPEDIATQCGI